MKIDVKHVAQLANLKIKPEDEEKFEKQLNEIVSYVEKLNEVDTKGVEITSQVTGLENVAREDVLDESRTLTQEEAISNTKSQENGLFKVKGVLNGE